MEARRYKGSRAILKSFALSSKWTCLFYTWSTPAQRNWLKRTLADMKNALLIIAQHGNKDFLSCISHLLTSQGWSEFPDLNNKYFWPLHWVRNIVLSLFKIIHHWLLSFMHMWCMNIFPREDEDRNNEQSPRNMQLIIYCSVIYQCHWSGDVFISSRWKMDTLKSNLNVLDKKITKQQNNEWKMSYII